MAPSIRNPLIRLHGSNKSLPGGKILRAGKLSLLYENGSIRYITAGGIEIIRMIYSAVRDDKWLTIEPEISNEIIEDTTDRFRISYHAAYKQNDIDFEADYSFTGSENEVICEFNGLANSSFMKNRIGFCVLHPVDTCKGKVCNIGHPDGSNTSSAFPVDIAPHQPFKNIRSMNWAPGNNLSVQINFFGDLFETEDQRNWTDASYKTYPTPLELPHPALVPKNTVIYQKVELKVNGVIEISGKKASNVVFRSTGSDLLRLPSVGICTSSRNGKMTLREAELLKLTGISHLRAEIHLFSENYSGQYDKAVHESGLLNLPVELCLIPGRNCLSDLQNFLTIYQSNPIRLSSIILLSQNHKVTPPEILRDGIPFIRKHFRNVATGAGTNCNFAQLNRESPDTEPLDFISFAIHPQEHAGDDRTLVENLAAQRDAVRSSLKLAGKSAVHVSPVTLQRRFNANEAYYEIPGDPARLPAQVDVRQMSLFGAAWTVGSMKHLFESGVESVTFYEGVGERGIMAGEFPSSWPSEFPADKDMLYPMYQVFRLLNPEYRVIQSESNFPLAVDGFVLAGEKNGIIFLSNFTPEEQIVEVEGFTGLQAIICMNLTSFNRIIQDLLPSRRKNETTFIMKPYETRFIKFDFPNYH